MIVLFTDFGSGGPYTGQMMAVLRRHMPPEMAVIELCADAPACNPKAAAYLLAACVGAFPPGSVFLCIVDPGVGGPRRPCVVQADGRWFVGPDNGLFELIIRRTAIAPRCWHITWKPERMSSSFHGRDLFAPVAALLARGQVPPGQEFPVGERCATDWPDDLAEVVYVDAFGNALTGLRATAVAAHSTINLGGCRVAKANTFSDVSPGRPFWYENSAGLIEIAVNRGRAAERFFLNIGSPIVMSVC
ncbi:MAG: SAM hydrolase/SAM-dependent halogenase family protein [Nitrospira sp.]